VREPVPPDPATTTEPVPLWHEGCVTLVIVAVSVLVVFVMLNPFVAGHIPVDVAV